MSSTPNIDSKSTNKPKHNKGKKNSEDTKNSETNKVREDTKGDKIHATKMAPKLVINTKKNVIIGGSKESSEIIKATSAAGEQIKEKELEEEGEGNLATVFENKDLVSPVTDKESNQPDNVLDIDTLNKKIESIRLQMADSLYGGFTNILATINDISDKVNQNKNRITSIENRVEKVEQYLADKIPDGGLLSLEKLVDYHQEMEKAKNSIIITKAKDLEESKDALKTLLPAVDIENDVILTTRYKTPRERNKEGRKAEDTPLPDNTDDENSENTAANKKLVSVKAKMSEEHFAIAIKDKNKLDNEAKFKHIFTNKFLT